MIKVHEVGHGTEYIAESHHGNGLGITGLVTGVTAAGLTLAGWAKDFLQNRNGGNCNLGQAVPALCAALAPVVSQAMGGCPVNENTVLTDQAMRIATLEAEKYTDAQIAKLYEYNRGNEKELWELKAEVKCLKEKLTDYALNEREKDGLREQIIDGKISKVQDSVICLAGKVDDGFKATNAGFAAVNARINDITVVYVPQSVICDKDNCCKKPQQ